MKKTKVKTSMGKFKRFARRAKSFGRKASRRAGVGNSAALFQLDAVAYGALRQPVSDAINKMIPIPVIGDLGDEVVMGLACYLVAKNTSGMLSNVAKKGLVVENARLGQQLSGMFLSGNTASSGGGFIGTTGY